MEVYVERETAVARMRVEDAEAAVQQEQEDMKHAESGGLMNRQAEMTLHKITVAIGDRRSDLASSDEGKDGDHENDEETEQGKLSEDDEPR